MSGLGRIVALGAITCCTYKIYQHVNPEQSDLINLRVQEVGSKIFAIIGNFLTDINTPTSTNDSNLKAFAMLGCLSIIALLAFSIFRRRERIND
jgi:hypothetical protein